MRIFSVLFALCLGLQYGAIAQPLDLCRQVPEKTFRYSRVGIESDDAFIVLLQRETDRQKLRAALADADLDRLRAYTEDETAEENASRMTLLAYAVSIGNANAVAVLLDAGAHPDTPVSWGATPLDMAFLNGEAKAACLLLEHGAIPPSPEDKAYLLPAVALTEDAEGSGNAMFLVELLHSFGFDLDARAGTGETALHIAAEWGNLPLLEWLVSHGADIGKYDAAGQTAEIAAKRAGQTLAAAFLENARLKRSGNPGQTP